MRLATLSQNGRAVIYLSLTWWSLLGKCLTLNCKLLRTNEMGVPPALPGRQSNFENSGSIPPAVAFVFAEARCLASLVPLQLLLLFTGCDQAPLRGQQP